MSNILTNTNNSWKYIEKVLNNALRIHQQTKKTKNAKLLALIVDTHVEPTRDEVVYIWLRA